MEYALRILCAGIYFILAGFMFGTVFWMRLERKYSGKLNETEISPDKPESHIN